MRALRKAEAGPGARLDEVPVPEPGPGEVLIEVQAASICGSDLHIYDWNPWAAGRIHRFPMTFGHEVAGRIAAVGPEVHHPDVGAFVAAETHLFCGHCRMCRTGRAHICENLRILGVDVDGAFADYVVIPAVNAWEVDPRIPAESASIMEPFGNAVHTVFSGGGEDVELATVVVLGCGPIGLFALGVARAAGARQVIAVEPNEYRLDLAKKMGADVADRSVEGRSGGGRAGRDRRSRRRGRPGDVGRLEGDRPGHAHARPRRPAVAPRACRPSRSRSTSPTRSSSRKRASSA